MKHSRCAHVVAPALAFLACCASPRAALVGTSARVGSESPRVETPAIASAAASTPSRQDASSPPSTGDASESGTDAEGYYRNLYRPLNLSLGAAAFTRFNTNLQISSDSAVG